MNDVRNPVAHPVPHPAPDHVPRALYGVAGLAGCAIGLFGTLIATTLARAGWSEPDIGINGSVFFACVMGAAPVAALLMRRTGARTAIALGLLLTAAGAMAFALTAGEGAWTLLRALMGLGVGLYMIGGQAALNALAPSARRGAVSGLQALSFGVGVGLGPLIGAALQLLSPLAAFTGGALLLVLGQLLVLQLPRVSQAVPPAADLSLWRRVTLPLHAVFAYGAAEATLMTQFPVFMLGRGYTVEAMSAAFAAFVIGRLASVLPITRLADRLGALRMTAGCAAFGTVACIVLIALPPDAPAGLLAAVCCLAGAAVGPLFPLALMALGHIVPAERLAGGSALFTAAFSLGSLGAPWFAGLAMHHWGGGFLFSFTAVLLASLWLRLRWSTAHLVPHVVPGGHPMDTHTRREGPDAREAQEPHRPGVSRRHLLWAGAGTGVAAGATALVLGDGRSEASAPAYQYWRHREKGALSDLEYLVMCATLAPSPHNTQPWRFHLQGDRIVVQADRSRHLGEADAQFRMMQIGLGCAIENLEIAASQLGYRCRIDTAAADERFGRDGECARVELTRGPVRADPAFEALFRRQTTRTGFDVQAAVPQALKERLEQAALALPGTRLHWLQASATADAVGDTVRQAARDYLSEARHRAGMKWFRIKRDEWERQGDGIAVFNSDAPQIAKRYVELFVDDADVMGPGFRDAEIASVDRLSAATPLWGLIVAEGPRPSQRLMAGRLAERVYLEATLQGHAVQPMCYPTETARGIANLRHLAGIPDGKEPVFLFRLGRADLVARSVRRPLRDVIA